MGMPRIQAESLFALVVSIALAIAPAAPPQDQAAERQRPQEQGQQVIDNDTNGSEYPATVSIQ